VIRLLLEQRCHFKVAKSDRVLATLNDGLSSPATVGKAFTIYPEPADCVRVAHALCDLLGGVPGPRILSDRRVRPDAPVFYRYGPFVATWGRAANHSLKLSLVGPRGETFDGEAQLAYRQPSWARDPFVGDAEDAAESGAENTVLGGRYQVIEGVFESARGNVYRCLDGDETVIVKQARAHVGASADSDVDARSRLRNERRILNELGGVVGVPQFIDHFSHGADEFLTTTDVGRQNLFDSTVFDGRFLIRPGLVPDGPSWAQGGDAFVTLCRQVATTLRYVHQRGVILRDITPRNIVLDDDGRASFIDFGISAHDGFHLPGATPGYAPAGQRRDNTAPSVDDDLYSLGLTLCFAASGLSPVAGLEDDAEVIRRMHQAMRRIYPGGLHPALRHALALLGRDDAAREALVFLAERPSTPITNAFSGSTTAPAVLPGLEEAVERIRTGVAAQAAQLRPFMWGSGGGPDGSVYTGTAGILWELLQHAERNGVVRPAIAHLVESTVAIRQSTAVGTGLYIGTTGIDAVLHLAERAGFEVLSDATLRTTGGESDGTDLMYGAAGVGLHLVQDNDAKGPPTAALTLARRMSRWDGYGIHSALDGGHGVSDVESRWGYAHGLAGLLEFYSALAVDDPASLDDVQRLIATISGAVPSLMSTATQRRPRPLAAGWCRGLAGIASSVIRAGEAHGVQYDRELTLSALTTCHAWVPRLANVSQCCGAAGIGNALIDAALALRDDDVWAMADDVATHVLLRSFARDDGLFFFPEPTPSTASWGLGAAGVLTFFRRLRDRGGPMPFTTTVERKP